MKKKIQFRPWVLCFAALCICPNILCAKIRVTNPPPTPPQPRPLHNKEWVIYDSWVKNSTEIHTAAEFDGVIATLRQHIAGGVEAAKQHTNTRCQEIEKKLDADVKALEKSILSGSPSALDTIAASSVISGLQEKLTATQEELKRVNERLKALEEIMKRSQDAQKLSGGEK